MLFKLKHARIVPGLVAYDTVNYVDCTKVLHYSVSLQLRRIQLYFGASSWMLVQFPGHDAATMAEFRDFCHAIDSELFAEFYTTEGGTHARVPQKPKTHRPVASSA